MALAVASCSFSAKANGYDWKWTVKERFKVLLSNETVAFLHGMVWRSFDTTVSTKLLSSLLIEEASSRSYNKYIIALLRSGSTGEYSVLGFCIGPSYGRANTASLEPNIFLYCPSPFIYICVFFSTIPDKVQLKFQLCCTQLWCLHFYFFHFKSSCWLSVRSGIWILAAPMIAIFLVSHDTFTHGKL